MSAATSITGVFIVVAAGVLVACSSGPAPAGDPDPGHSLLDALAPVAAAVPDGVRVERHDLVEPKWDSCDGTASTYGWDDVTVDVQFGPNGLSDESIVSHIKGALQSLGWIYDATSEDGAWYWHRELGEGHRGEIQLLGGAADNPPDSWDLQATTAAATHPIEC